MGKLTRLELYEVMASTGLVPLFNHSDIDVAKKIISACYKGGAKVIEFTARSQNSHKVFEDLVLYANKNYPDMALGVGSITDSSAASYYIQLGADFIVTPVFRKDIAIVCNRRKVAFFPGCGSLSEIARAEEYGCEIVKLFPGAIYGPEFIKAIQGPQPWTSIMPTGGVSPTKESLAKWFKSGSICVGIGAKLFSRKENGLYEFVQIEETIRNCLEIIKEVRKEQNQILLKN